MDRSKLTFESFMAAYFCAAQAYHYWRLRGEPIAHRDHWGNPPSSPELTKVACGGWPRGCYDIGLTQHYRRRIGSARLDAWRWANPNTDRPRGTGPAQADCLTPPPPRDNGGGSPSGSLSGWLCGACGSWTINAEEG